MKYFIQREGAGTPTSPTGVPDFHTKRQPSKPGLLLSWPQEQSARPKLGSRRKATQAQKVRSQGDLMLADWQGKEVSEDPTGVGTV